MPELGTSVVLNAAGQNYSVNCSESSTGVFQIATDAAWNGTLSFQVSVDGTNYTTADFINVNTGNPAQTYTTANTNAQFRGAVAGFAYYRLRVTTYVAGTATVIGRTDAGISNFSLDNPIPAGTNTIGSVKAIGTQNHDDPDSGAPVKIGARALDVAATPTAVAVNDRTDLYAFRWGSLSTLSGHPNQTTIRYNTAVAVTDAAIVSVSAGTRIVVTGFQVTCSFANTLNPSVILGFGTANTPTTTQVFGAHSGVAPGGGFGRGNGGSILGIGADNEDVRITTTTASDVTVVLTYFTTAV